MYTLISNPMKKIMLWKLKVVIIAENVLFADLRVWFRMNFNVFVVDIFFENENSVFDTEFGIGVKIYPEKQFAYVYSLLFPAKTA